MVRRCWRQGCGRAALRGKKSRSKPVTTVRTLAAPCRHPAVVYGPAACRSAAGLDDGQEDLDRCDGSCQPTLRSRRRPRRGEVEHALEGNGTPTYNERATGCETVMTSEDTIQVFLCPRCLSADGMPGRCPSCGAERLGCRPGAPDDPCRRPIIDSQGQVRTRAPMWWLRASLAQLPHWLDADRRVQP